MPLIFMAVGRHEPFVPLARPEACAQTLREAGARLEYRVCEADHRLNAEGMRDLRQWWSDRGEH